MVKWMVRTREKKHRFVFSSNIELSYMIITSPSLPCIVLLQHYMAFDKVCLGLILPLDLIIGT